VEHSLMKGGVGRLSTRKFDDASPPLRAGQARGFGLLLPIRLRVGADDSAARAHPARAERRHRHVVRPRIGAYDRLMVAQVACHRDRAHAAKRILPLVCPKPFFGFCGAD